MSSPTGTNVNPRARSVSKMTGSASAVCSPLLWQRMMDPLFAFADDALCDLLCGEVLPVEGVDVPLDGHEPQGERRVDDGVVVVAEGRAEESHLLPRHFRDGAGRGRKLGFDRLFGELRHFGVRRAVRADLVPRLVDLFEIVGVLLRPELHGEEGRLDVRLFERFQDGIGVLGTPRAVKRDGKGVVLPLHAVNGQGARPAPKDFLRPRRSRRKCGKGDGRRQGRS